MGLPHTLIGIAGFITFVAFVMGSVLQEDTNSFLSETNGHIQGALAESANQTNPVYKLLNDANVAVSTASMPIAAYLDLAGFMLDPAKMPNDFVLIYILIGFTLIVAIYKAFRGIAEMT